MHTDTTAREAFVELVRQALGLLNTPQLLQGHPLAIRLSIDGTPLDGETLQRALTDAIRALRPAQASASSTSALRRYRYLWLRYVEGLAPPDIASHLGVTDRQARRDHRDALESVAAILWVRFKGTPWEPMESSATDDPPVGRIVAAAEDEALVQELARLVGSVPPGPTALPETLDGVLRTAERLLADHQLELVVDVPADLPAMAVNGVVLRQALMSVLGHIGQDASPGTLQIVAHSTGRQIQIAFTYYPCVTELATAQEMVDGPLALARQIVQAVGGSVSEQSSREGQVTIALDLPAMQPITVLVVDDNLDFLRLTRRILEGDAYRVLEASVPSEALRLAREAHPDAIILDVLMPTVDGWELLAALRRDPATSSIPVLVCSVLRNPSLVAQMGGAGFLAKPFTPAGLLAALQQVGVQPQAQ